MYNTGMYDVCIYIYTYTYIQRSRQIENSLEKITKTGKSNEAQPQKQMCVSPSTII